MPLGSLILLAHGGGQLLNGAELKRWRKKIGFTQEEAAHEFGVSRPTVQNWEYEITSVPLVVELASRRLLRRWKQRREYGPVFLVDLDPLKNKFRSETLCGFGCSDNASAFQIIAERGILSSLIMDEDNQIIWSGVSLHLEVEKHWRPIREPSR